VYSCIFTKGSTYNPFTEQPQKYFSMLTSNKKEEKIKKCQFNTLDSCRYISLVQPIKYHIRYISKDVNGFLQVKIYR